jgi:hypothetical protein
MSSTGIIMSFFAPIKAVIFSAIFMALVAVWAWRYPSTVEEWQRRTDNNERIGWFR